MGCMTKSRGWVARCLTGTFDIWWRFWMYRGDRESPVHVRSEQELWGRRGERLGRGIGGDGNDGAGCRDAFRKTWSKRWRGGEKVCWRGRKGIPFVGLSACEWLWAKMVHGWLFCYDTQVTATLRRQLQPFRTTSAAVAVSEYIWHLLSSLPSPCGDPLNPRSLYSARSFWHIPLPWLPADIQDLTIQIIVFATHVHWWNIRDETYRTVHTISIATCIAHLHISADFGNSFIQLHEKFQKIVKPLSTTEHCNSWAECRCRENKQ